MSRRPPSVNKQARPGVPEPPADHPARAQANAQRLRITAAALPLLVLVWAYWPVMNTPFLFDDTYQRYALPETPSALASWIGPVRPVLMLSYWANMQVSRTETLSFHVVNLAIHAVSALLSFFVIRRLAEWAGIDGQHRAWLAWFGAALFLLHPLQTESVAYIAGRSEALSGMFALAAIAVFLYRRSMAISWAGVAAVMLLFGAALLSKEQAVMVPVALLLTDYWWNPGFSLKGIIGNWKLYGLMALGGVAGVALFWNMILGRGTGGSAGFGIKDFTWYQYLFTQFRALWVYMANFVAPLNLNVDWEFPISRTLLDRGAIVGLVGLAALAAAAWYFRKRFALAAYGYFLFLIFLLPTSSILPIKDPVADRRMYLPLIGLTLMAIDFLGRLRVNRTALLGACASILLVMSALTHARAAVWSDPVTLWQDAVAKSPGKSRPHFQLAQTYAFGQRFDLAVPEFEKAAALEKPGFDMLIDWGLALDGMHRPAQALEKFEQAVSAPGNPPRDTAHAYTQIGKVYAEQSDWQRAMAAFEAAERADPSFPATYAYKGLVHLAQNDAAGAVPECRHALAIDANFQPARDCLATAEKMGAR